MIDTVGLVMKGNYQISCYEAFSPSARDLFEYPYRKWGKEGFQKSIQNPLKSDKQYKPRLTITKHRMIGSFPVLKIELSLPKLRFGNNFVELDDYDFSTVIDYLQVRLKDMGVRVSSEELAKSKVGVVHYSKNILLEQGFTCEMILREIHKSYINSKLDDCVVKFRNDGHALTFHSNSYEITFYDKIKDIEQSRISPKRAIERDNNPNLFGNKFSYTTQVLRMEVRLNKITKIKNILDKLGWKNDLVFKDLFSKKISKDILNYYWNILTKNMAISVNPLKASAEEMFLSSNQQKITQKLAQVGFLKLQEELGLKVLRGLLISTSDIRAGTRTIKKYAVPVVERDIYSLVSKITQDLKEYKLLNFEDFKNIFERGV